MLLLPSSPPNVAPVVSSEELFDIMDEQLRPSTNLPQASDPRVASRDPNVHVCLGVRCPYAQLSREHTMVCAVTGACFGQAAYNDPLTAGIVSVLDENGVRSGGRSQPARPRRHDPAAAQRAAMAMAASLAQQERDAARLRTPALHPENVDDAPGDSLVAEAAAPPPHYPPADVAPKLASRAALAADPTKSLERIWTVEALEVLRRDAEDILDKLTRHPKRSSPATSGENRVQKSARLVGPGEAREMEVAAPLQRLDTHFPVRTYMRRCQIIGDVASLDHLHNICLNRERELATARRRTLAQQHVAGRGERYLQLRTRAAGLVVSLWQAALRTPYMRRMHIKRAPDAFRPFAAGIFLSMRYGVKLADGTDLVPACEAINMVLPQVRAAHRGTPTHEAHLSAHKGVSCLQKCIASVPERDARDFFAGATRAAVAVREATVSA